MGKKIIAVAVLGVLAGCATTVETQYFTLDMRDADPGEPAAAVRVDRIIVAEPLSRKDILIQKTPTEVEYYATAQWAAGIDDLVTEKLEAEFGHMPLDADPFLLSGVLYQFEQVDVGGGAEAHAQLDVELRTERYGDPVFEKTYTERMAAGAAAPGPVVQALSRCVERIAARVLEDAAAL